jgi:hypothetical protein
MTFLKVAAAAVAVGVLYRLYQAHQNAVPFGTALTHPFLPIASLRRPGSPLGPKQVVDLQAHPETRRGPGHF